MRLKHATNYAPALLWALFDSNTDLVERQSRQHCHVRGLHSLVLHQYANGNLVRLYIAEPGSDLDMPAEGHGRPNVDPTFALGLHPHHCELSLTPLRGRILHVTMGFCADETTAHYSLPAYRYHSQLRGEQPGFEREPGGPHHLRIVDSRILTGDTTVVLAAQDLHTMNVQRGTGYAAWLVEEGPEDPAYEPLTFSPHDLTRFDFSGLYQPADAQYWRELLVKAGLH